MAFVTAWRRATVYAVVDRDGARHWRYSLRPHIDAAYWRERGARRIIPLEPPAPAMWAEYACRTARRAEARREGQRDRPPRATRHDAAAPFQRILRSLGKAWPAGRRDPVVARVNRTLQLAGYEPGVRTGPAVELRHLEDREGLADIAELRTPSEAHLEAVAKVLAGRRLSTREVERFMEQKLPGTETSVADCLAWLTASGRVRQMPGVQRGAFGRLRCARCGETDRARAWDCAVCGEERCWVCEACRSLGPVRSCTVLYAAPVDTAAAPAVHGGSTSLGEADGVVLLAPTLTPAQKKASDALVSFVRGSREDALVWAVCGAGKTEMCFAAVAAELARGGRVLFAVPRRDVVRELGPRLRAAFPHVQLQVLHGGADRAVLPVLPPGSVTVATTHQVLRYDRAFDLVILDEADAFPYRGSRVLAQAVVRATAPGGRRIRMTATPDNELLRSADQGQSILVRVPARHHGRPLPVPELMADKTLDGGAAGHDHAGRRPFKPSRLLMSLIHRSLTDAPPVRVLVFVPTVSLSERVGFALAQLLPGDVLWSHGRDPGRAEKLDAFLRGQAKVFVATSILERGVTVPDVDVIVLYADAERIFQEPALIQMAGRVGRTAARPGGRVAFVGRRVTPVMRQAVAHIESMNEEAAALGLLRIEPSAVQAAFRAGRAPGGACAVRGEGGDR